ncbi:transporter substrate-binding domain-containing protein [soil metagenome]
MTLTTFARHAGAKLAVASLLAVAAGAASAQAGGTLDKIKETKAITVAYRDASVPFSYLDDNQKPVGFAYELCEKIIANVKTATGVKDLKVNYQPVTSANRIPLLQNGTIDIECGSTTNNSERGKVVSFSTNYFYTGTRLLVKTSSGIKTFTDLKGKTLVSTSGTTNLKLVTQLNTDKNWGATVIAAKDHAEAATLVALGRADAFAMDDILLYGLRANASNPAELAVVGDAIQVEPYAAMVRKDDTAFKKIVDDTINGMMKSGEFEKLYTKWFQSKIPPKGIDLGAAMPTELKDNIKNPTDKPAL